MQQCLAFFSWHCCWLYRSPLSATVARRPPLSLLCIGIHNIWDSCVFSTWCDTVRNIQCAPVKLADSQVNLLHTTTATKNNNNLLLQAVDCHVLHSSAINAGRSLATLLPVVFLVHSIYQDVWYTVHFWPPFSLFAGVYWLTRCFVYLGGGCLWQPTFAVCDALGFFSDVLSISLFQTIPEAQRLRIFEYTT